MDAHISPFFFISDTLGPEQLIPGIKSQPDTAQGLPADYITELVNRFNDDGLDMVNGCGNKLI